jgi:hypothetical protein
MRRLPLSPLRGLVRGGAVSRGLRPWLLNAAPPGLGRGGFETASRSSSSSARTAPWNVGEVPGVDPGSGRVDLDIELAVGSFDDCISSVHPLLQGVPQWERGMARLSSPLINCRG